MTDPFSRSGLVGLCLACGLLAAACESLSQANYPAARASELAGARWVAQSIDGAAIAVEAPFIRFGADDRLIGSGGCNTLSAIYETNEGAIDVRALGATRRACDPQLMRQEARFLLLLAQAERYVREPGRLILADDDGRRIVFAEGA